MSTPPDHADPSVARSFEACVDYLRQRLETSLPGTEAQLTMAPVYRQDPSMASIADKACREAGVLALVFPVEDTPHLLLTVRRPDLTDHAGQVSFPGGQREGTETLEEAALREAHEEVGLPPDAVRVLGALTPLYIPPSNFCVHPFVGAASDPPPLSPQDAEVATILRVPLAHLLAPTTRRVEPWTLRGETIDVPFYEVETQSVWGATAMMLAELLALFQG
ncbi:MAG: NUDIX domain-containing protein [Bacteroidetes bacterium]|jgi:8-oxo-dGTP pyrophosphatase MutT (NUDIX family)|nr:NUDIX domain-containing protein [Bacteroidota bacterium]